jgi:ankyrin repeat domain-containing protein 17
MSNTPTHSIAASISQPQTPTPSPIISPSAMLPIYPAIDIDAQVSSKFRRDSFLMELNHHYKC